MPRKNKSLDTESSNESCRYCGDVVLPGNAIQRHKLRKYRIPSIRGPLSARARRLQKLVEKLSMRPKPYPIRRLRRRANKRPKKQAKIEINQNCPEVTPNQLGLTPSQLLAMPMDLSLAPMLKGIVLGLRLGPVIGTTPINWAELLRAPPFPATQTENPPQQPSENNSEEERVSQMSADIGEQFVSRVSINQPEVPSQAIDPKSIHTQTDFQFPVEPSSDSISSVASFASVQSHISLEKDDPTVKADEEPAQKSMGGEDDDKGDCQPQSA